jgi:preprotein translocase SecE subunit
VNAFFQELVHAGIYKRSQGRITRQLTWVAMAVLVALGLWRLSIGLKGWDPGFRSELRAQDAGRVEFTPSGEVVIVDAQGQQLEEHRIPEGATLTVKEHEEVEAGTVLCQWNPLSSPWARGALAYGLPGLLLIAGLWVSYRIVNVPSAADFLIAVEAEMNKVSWPNRSELFRASVVVLFTIFFLAAVLFGFDSFWRWFFDVLKLFPQAAQTAMAGVGRDWRILLIVVPGVC